MTPLRLRQRASRHSQQDGVVAREDQVNPDDLDQADQRMRGFHIHLKIPPAFGHFDISHEDISHNTMN